MAPDKLQVSDQACEGIPTRKVLHVNDQTLE